MELPSALDGLINRNESVSRLSTHDELLADIGRTILQYTSTIKGVVEGTWRGPGDRMRHYSQQERERRQQVAAFNAEKGNQSLKDLTTLYLADLLVQMHEALVSTEGLGQLSQRYGLDEMVLQRAREIAMSIRLRTWSDTIRGAEDMMSSMADWREMMAEVGNTDEIQQLLPAKALRVLGAVSWKLLVETNPILGYMPKKA